jgi:hypothetical protein
MPGALRFSSSPRAVVHAVEAADHEAVEHVDHRLGRRRPAGYSQVGVRPLLHHAPPDTAMPFLDHRHLLALLAVGADRNSDGVACTLITPMP